MAGMTALLVNFSVTRVTFRVEESSAGSQILAFHPACLSTPHWFFLFFLFN